MMQSTLSRVARAIKRDQPHDGCNEVPLKGTVMVRRTKVHLTMVEEGDLCLRPAF